MKSNKERIQFHPQRPNRSKSRTKFSPYQPHFSNDKQYSLAKQSREKLTLKEPIIKIRQLMAGNTQKNRLTLSSEKPLFEPSLMSATNFSNCNFHSPFQTIENTNFSDLAAKIDQQSQVIEQYFTELNKKLKLPRIEPYEQKNEKQAQKQKQTQNLILEELKQLKLITSENMHLRQIILRYEREAQFYRAEMENWQTESAALLQKISSLENSLKIVEKEKEEEKQANRLFLNEIESKSSIKMSKEFMKISKESVTKEEDEKQFKLMQTEKEIKNQMVIIQNLKKEIENLKLQNEMLSEQVKLLNYSLNERDREIEKLKRKKSIIRERTSSRKSSACEHISLIDKSINEMQNQPKQVESIKGMEREEPENVEFSNRRNNKTKSFIIEPNSIKEKLSLKPRRSEIYSSAKRRCSIDEKMLSQNIFKALSLCQAPTLKKSSTSESRYKVNHEKLNAQIDKRKMNFAKSILKINAKNTILQQKKSGKRERKQFLNLNAERLADLEIVRKTIGGRWRVLRCSFADIQLQLLQRKSAKISQKEMTEYLQVYPFFLNIELIQEVIRYILREDYKEQQQCEEWPTVEVDVFCNHLKEFIPETAGFEQEQEMAMLQKIKNVVMSKNISLLEQLRYEEVEQGVIRQAQMRTVLQQFKFSQPEILLMIGQCCLISLDIEHLSYERYFSFFNPAGSSQN